MFADPHDVRITNGQVLAHHSRCYDKDAQIEDYAHIESLLREKGVAAQHLSARYLPVHPQESSRVIFTGPVANVII